MSIMSKHHYEDVSEPAAGDKPLFTPGPLTTSPTVKRAMLRDLGSRDVEFIRTVREVRDGLLRAAGVAQRAGWEAVLMQGAGTFGIEAMITCAVPRSGKLMVVINGAYGDRIAKIASVHGIATNLVRFHESEPVDPAKVDAALAADPGVTDVAVVHCETTTGVFNDMLAVGRVVKKHGKRFLVDSMSAFGAVPIDLEACGVDFLVSSANKNVQGVPGFSFCIAKRSALEATTGNSRTLSLDLLDQCKGLEKSGQFRFTPPTHTILAFHQALRELEDEGGVEGRAARYRRNHAAIVTAMRKLGFVEYLRPEHQGWIITSFRYPADPKFDFERFYTLLNDRGFVIYPGKVSDADCFRIGNIGHLFERDMLALAEAIEAVIAEMGVNVRTQIA